MKNINEIAELYEGAALTACREAEQGGQEPPRLLSVHATAGGYVEDFIAPRGAFMDIRRAMVAIRGDYRVTFI